MNIALFEDAGWQSLLPLTWMRGTFELCCGRDRLIDKLEAGCGRRPCGLLVRKSLVSVMAARFQLADAESGAAWCLMNGASLVTEPLEPPPLGVAWMQGERLVAVTVGEEVAYGVGVDQFMDAGKLAHWLGAYKQVPAPDGIRLISHPWELPLANAAELTRQCADGGRCEGRVYPGAHLLNEAAITIEQDAIIKPGVVLDAEEGPIHIAAGAKIEPNAVIEGPCYVGPKSIVRPGAVIRHGTTIGPVCRVGGEVEASIIQGYSNKQHDGFLGHSYLAQWVNIGADTVTSDLKNTYGTIRVAINGLDVESGERFVGSTIGDHSKTGIGTILPTGCVVGVASNVFTQQGVPKFVPSFAWLTDAGMTQYRTEKALSLARVVMERRGLYLTDAEAALIEDVSEAARSVEAAGWD